MYINYNGDLIPEDQAIFNTYNRAFKYADGFFETLRLINNKLPFYHLHLKRILYGFKCLEFQNSEVLDNFKAQILITANYNNLQNASIRLSFFRNDGGKYLPLSNRALFTINCTPLDGDRYTYNSTGLKLGIYKFAKIFYTPYSRLKLVESLPYVLGSLHAQKNKLDSVLLLNNQDFISDSLDSNVFFVRGKTLYTPCLSSGCVEGVMRKVTMTLANERGVRVVQADNIKCESLDYFSEIFLTNAIKGIRPVVSLENKKFKTEFSYKLYEQLIKSLNFV